MYNKRNASSIYLKSISVNNFMCFDEFSIDDLDKYNLIFIFGNNWSGKSTITSEVLFFSLFGESLRYGKTYKELKNWNAPNKKTSVRLGLKCHFNDGECCDFYINRVISKKDYSFSFNSTCENKFKDFFNNIIKKKDLNYYLSDFVGVDKDKFNILYLKSPYSKNFFESNSDLLVNITQSNYINEIQSEFKDIANILNNKIKHLKEGIKQQISIREGLKTNNKNIDVEKIKNRIDEIKSLLKKYEIKNKNFNNKKREIEDILDKINDYIIKYNESISNLVSRKNSLIKEINKYNKLQKLGKCPVCEHNIDEFEYSDLIKNLTTQKNKHDNKLKALKDKLKSIKDKKNKYVSEKRKINIVTEKIRNNINQLNNKLSQLNTIIKSEEKTNKNTNNIITKINKKISQYEENLVTAEHDFSLYKNILLKLLAKNSKYINDFYNYRISNFIKIYNVILNKISNGKFYNIKISLNNKPILNDNISYKALSTSQKKIVDISFVISYIIYQSKQMTSKYFILDEFMEANFDKKTSLHIFNIIKELATEYNLQFLITSNISDYLYSNISDSISVKIIDISR